MVHERIRRAREAQGLSLRAVAETARVDDGHLSRFERGEAQMGSDALGRVLAALGLEVLPAPVLDDDGVVAVPPEVRQEHGLDDLDPSDITVKTFSLPDPTSDSSAA